MNGTFHHPSCAHFEENEKGDYVQPRKDCNCGDWEPEDPKPELGDVISTIAPRRHFQPIEIEAEVTQCCKNGSYKVRALTCEDLAGKTMIVPADRVTLLRRAG